MKTKLCSDRYRKMAERMWPIIKANYEGAPPWGKRPDSIDLITAALRRVAKSEYKRGLVFAANQTEPELYTEIGELRLRPKSKQR